jgi:hypothetical protein
MTEHQRISPWERFVLGFVIIAVGVGLSIACLFSSDALAAPSAAAKAPHQTVAALRVAIRWNHTVVTTLNRRIAIANDRAGGGRANPTCHAIESCRLLLRRQQHARIWAEGAWQRLITSETPSGAMRIVRYRFHGCGATAVARAISIVGWESRWERFNVNAAGDTGWWQIELPAHPDVSYAQATDAWESTGIAVRWSKCGANWSPTWSSVRDHGKDWD